MPEETSTNLPKSLSHFLIQSDLDYKNSLSSIPLFDVKRTIFWDDNLRKMFASIFYHLRGHFINFLWYVANFADNEASKQIIIQNIYEEIGIGNRFSHEKLYERFAKECGVDIHDEIVNETNYILPKNLIKLIYPGWRNMILKIICVLLRLMSAWIILIILFLLNLPNR